MDVPDSFQVSARLSVAQQPLVHVLSASQIHNHDVLRFEEIMATLRW
jgi:hypothetical protein